MQWTEPAISITKGPRGRFVSPVWGIGFGPVLTLPLPGLITSPLTEEINREHRSRSHGCTIQIHSGAALTVSGIDPGTFPAPPCSSLHVGLCKSLQDATCFLLRLSSRGNTSPGRPNSEWLTFVSTYGNLRANFFRSRQYTESKGPDSPLEMTHRAHLSTNHLRRY